jgi:hypothetical protein
MTKRKRSPSKPRRGREPASGARGAPRAVIDLAQLEALAAIGCSVDEMAAVMGVSSRTLERRPDCVAARKKGELQGNMSLKRTMWRSANGTLDPDDVAGIARGTQRYLIAPDRTMQIWVSKNRLGWRDQPDLTLGDGTLPTLAVEGDPESTNGN